MAQVIIKNSNGQVIRNLTGTILKQNYQFGKSLKNTASSPLTDIRFNIGLNTTDSFTVLFWMKITGSPVSGSFPIFIPSLIGTSSYDGSINGTSGWINSRFQNPSGVNVGAISANTNRLVGVEIVEGKARFRTELAVEADLGRVMPSVLSYIRLAFQIPSAWGLKTSSFLAFNRILTSGEIKFLWNHGIGNEPASREGLLCESLMSTAEILDFSESQDGSDMRVGCRDTSGNNTHGEIIGLPAGTLTDKLNYANTNLFNTTW